MFTHSYINLRHGVLHSRDYVIPATGHRIKDYLETIHYDDIVWC